ncbi:MAG: hypothetical protein R2744_09015 [Bacteroidales bacterium]
MVRLVLFMVMGRRTGYPGFMVMQFFRRFSLLRVVAAVTHDGKSERIAAIAIKYLIFIMVIFLRFSQTATLSF